MPGKVSKNMAMGAGIIGFILLGCGLGCAVAGFVWTAHGEGAHGIWSGIFVSTLCFSVCPNNASANLQRSKLTLIHFQLLNCNRHFRC